jgi:putative ABC transport system permease protein
MRIGEAVRVGLAGLETHKLRTFLTALGIIFGVASVIAMLSIGEGAKQEALEQFSLLGIQNVIVHHRGIPASAATGEATQPSPGLTLADARAVALTNPLVDLVIPAAERERSVRHGREEASVPVVGTTPDLPQATGQSVVRGRFFSHQDVLDTRRVCVLGSGVARDLFLFEDPVGARLKVGSEWYTVVGVLAPRGSGGGEDLEYVRDTNRDVYVPISNVLHRMGPEEDQAELDRMVVRVADHERVREAANILSRTLARRHRGVSDYELVVPEQLLRQRQSTLRIFNVVMGAIAGISLMVGGIGIMNIMLASVMERTREIGVRRALGATHRDILLQFLLEAVAVSILGAMVGIILGFALTQAIATYAGWRTVVSATAVLLAVGVAASVGIVFGIYPARRAARMDPIESLRYE